jgi:hypothetical protein
MYAILVLYESARIAHTVYFIKKLCANYIADISKKRHWMLINLMKHNARVQ